MNLTRRAFLASAAAIAAAARTAQAAERPNIFLIMVDDLGFGDLACYGASGMRTPHLDALAARGLRFERFYANCPVCSPTRAALMTGCYPDKVGVPGVIRTHWEDNWGRLAPDAPSMAQTLRDGGYDTALVGKWHLGLDAPDRPNDRGFAFFHGWLGDMMDDYYAHRRHDINYMRRNEETIDPEGHATDLFTDWAADYLRDPARANAPFFLFLSYNAPHTPIQPPEDWVAKVKTREPAMADDRAKLVALIEHMDDGVGRVLAALRESGREDNTLVVFTSDNGGQSNRAAQNGPLRGGKGDMYEGGIRVPAIAAWPGRIAPAVERETVAMTMDLLPTFCAAAGIEAPPEIDGRGLLPALDGEPQANDRTLVWVRREGGPFGGQDYYAIRKGPWKLVQNTPFEPFTLYNLDADPLEAQPLPTGHAMHGELFAALREHVALAGQTPWQRERPSS